MRLFGLDASIRDSRDIDIVRYTRNRLELRFQAHLGMSQGSPPR